MLGWLFFVGRTRVGVDTSGVAQYASHMAPNLSAPAVTDRLTVVPTADNILSVYALASVADLAEGMAWYRTANALARRLNPSDPRQAAGVLAAMSPITGWEQNMMLAIRAYEDGFASGTLFRNAAKANEILAGAEPLDVLGGNKVRNFFMAIADPDTGKGVCIDRHAFDIAVGRVTNDITRRMLDRKGVYENFADAYREAANIAGISPCQMQSVTWITWRRIKGITA